MNNRVKLILMASFLVLAVASCKSGDPHRRGIAAGKEACECYKLSGIDTVLACLDRIDAENKEYQNDTAYTNAMEQQMLNCLSEGVVDITNPIK